MTVSPTTPAQQQFNTTDILRLDFVSLRRGWERAKRNYMWQVWTRTRTMLQRRYGEMWICVAGECEDVCMWFAAKSIFAWHIVALNPGQSIQPIQTQHHTKFAPIRAGPEFRTFVLHLRRLFISEVATTILWWSIRRFVVSRSGGRQVMVKRFFFLLSLLNKPYCC